MFWTVMPVRSFPSGLKTAGMIGAVWIFRTIWSRSSRKVGPGRSRSHPTRSTSRWLTISPKKLPRRRPSQSRVPDDIPVWWLGDANYAPYVDDRLVHTIGLRHLDKVYVLST